MNIKSCVFFLVSFAMFYYDLQADTTRSNEKNDLITRNVISYFPKTPDVVNAVCITTNHGRNRVVNGLNIEIPGSKTVEYFYYMLRRDMSMEKFATINGVTIGLNTMFFEHNGLSISALGIEAYRANGVLIGAFNAASEMNGVQIGFANMANNGQLVQIGAINTIYSNPRFLRNLPVINFRFSRNKNDEEDES
jgi:hypothetical protein